MDWLKIIEDMVLVVLVPLIGIAVKSLVAYLQEKTDNAIIKKYIGLAENAVVQAVEYVAQTYVDALKKAGDFSEDAQIHAFELAKEKALDILGAEAVDMLNSIYGDFAIWLETAIEQHCRDLKQVNANETV